MYIRNSISKGVTLIKNHHDTIIWLRLDKSFFNLSKDVFLAGVYIWVENSPCYDLMNVDLFSLIDSDIREYELRGNVMLTGDWNARIGNKKDYVSCDKNTIFSDEEIHFPDTPLQRASLDTKHNNFGYKLLDLCKANGLRIANGRLHDDFNKGSYTFSHVLGASVIDYLLLRQCDFNLLSSFGITPFNVFSDHAPIYFSITCNTNVDKGSDCYYKTIIKWDGELRDKFRTNIISKLPEFNSISDKVRDADGNTIQSCIDDFTQIIRCVADPLFCKNISVSDKPRPRKSVVKLADWFDDECVLAKSNYLSSVKLFIREKSDINRISMCSKKSYYKKLIKKKKRAYTHNKMKSIEKLRHKNPIDFWKLFSRKNIAMTNEISVEEFYDFFSMLNLPSDTDNDIAESFCSEHDFNSDECAYDELDSVISVDEIQCVIRSLKRNKAVANDLLLNEYFIESCDILSSHLADLFNAILNTGVFPESWMEGLIIPLHKKNDTSDVNNYRGITLVSCFSKIFTGVLNNRINKWINNNNILSDLQFGFRKGRSTVDAIFVLNAIIDITLSKNGRLPCAFIDLSKAFDSIYRKGLWFKLHKLGINGKLLRVIKNMYSNVKARIKGCRSYSDYFNCSIGLKQGEVMSPVLFSLFLDDLESYLLEGNNGGLNIDDLTFILMLFADDMVIIGKNPNDLQCSLDLLKTYCDNWGLKVNSTKSKIVVFRKRGALKENEQWNFNGVPLETVDYFNYLGTIFNFNGSFSSNSENIVGKGIRALHCLLANTKSYNFKLSTMFQLFDAFVGSTLNYASEIWGFSKNKEIERIHLKFCKLLLNVKSSTASMGIYGELGRYPLYINRYVRIIKFWCKIISSENIIVKHLYKCMLKDCENGKKNWASNVKSLLDSFGFSNAWLDQANIVHNQFHCIFKQRVCDVFTQAWCNSIIESSSLRSYITFKSILCYEKYLDFVPSKYRVALSRLRLASHQLRVVTGSYGNNRIEYANRTCNICNSSDIEDDYHFVIVCHVYKDLRKKYIKQYYMNRPSVFKYTQLMQSSNKTLIINLAKYVYYAFSLRQSILNDTV